MRLFHGTSEDAARRAQTEGILPRAMTGVPATWHGKGRADLVYLGIGFIPSFASKAARGGKWGFVEVETDLLDEGALVPDEDLAEPIAEHLPELLPSFDTAEESLAWFRARLADYATMWQASLEILGRCAHVGPIRAEAITRIAIFDPARRPLLARVALEVPEDDPLAGARTREFVKWLLGHDFDPMIVAVGERPADPETLPPEKRQLSMQLAWALADRSGIEFLHHEHDPRWRRRPLRTIAALRRRVV